MQQPLEQNWVELQSSALAQTVTPSEHWFSPLHDSGRSSAD
jgi:hypothetical protein